MTFQAPSNRCLRRALGLTLGSVVILKLQNGGKEERGGGGRKNRYAGWSDEKKTRCGIIFILDTVIPSCLGFIVPRHWPDAQCGLSNFKLPSTNTK